MKKIYTALVITGLIIISALQIQAQEQVVLPPGYQPDTRIDNMGYWRAMAEYGQFPSNFLYFPSCPADRHVRLFLGDVPC